MDRDATLDMDQEDIWAFFPTAAPQTGLARHTRICRLMSPSVPCSKSMILVGACLALAPAFTPRSTGKNHRRAAWLAGASGPQGRKSDGIVPCGRVATAGSRSLGEMRVVKPHAGVSLMYAPTALCWLVELKSALVLDLDSSTLDCSTLDSRSPGSACCCFCCLQRGMLCVSTPCQCRRHLHRAWDCDRPLNGRHELTAVLLQLGGRCPYYLHAAQLPPL